MPRRTAPGLSSPSSVGRLRRVGRPLVAIGLSTILVGLFASSASAAVSGGWNHVGTGGGPGTVSLNGAVSAMNTDEPGVLLVGGAFTNAGGKPAADYIASWDGGAWSAVGVGLNGTVHAIAYHAGKVYAGGDFTNAGGNPKADFLAVWGGTQWKPFCTSTTSDPSFGGSVAALQIIGQTLYVGGAFQNGAQIPAADYLLACNLNTGESSSTVSGDGDFTAAVNSLTADSNGTLYAGGQFINLDGILEADHVAAYDGSWHAMGDEAVPGIVRSVTSSGTDVFVSSDAIDIASIPQADHVAMWNGSSWSAVGSNTAGTNGWFPASAFIYSMTTSGSLVFATGSFQNANGDPLADDVAYFAGTAWHHIGSNGAGNGPWIGSGLALGVFHSSFDRQLYAGGNFTTAGTDTHASYAASYPTVLPDARIGTAAAGPFVGNNVYYPDRESKTISVARGHSGTFFLDFQNDGLFPDALRIGANSGTSSGFTASYFRGATNVTGQINNCCYSTGTLAPGARATLRMVVKVDGLSDNISTFTVFAFPSMTTIPHDKVDAIVKAT